MLMKIEEDRVEPEEGFVMTFSRRVPNRHGYAMTRKWGEVFLPASHLRKGFSPEGKPIYYKSGEERQFPKKGQKIKVVASKCRDETYLGVHWTLAD
jgi:hypothetical protein